MIDIPTEQSPVMQSEQNKVPFPVVDETEGSSVGDSVGAQPRKA
jgi:hypothetical protein